MNVKAVHFSIFGYITLGKFIEKMKEEREIEN